MRCSFPTAVVFFLWGVATAFGAATGTMSVTGGTVYGIGTISGAVNVGSAGNLSPGATVGTLPIDGDLDVSSMANGGSGKLTFDLSTVAGSNDKITVVGTLTIGVGKLGFSDFVFTNPSSVEIGTYTLITSGGIKVGDSLDTSNIRGTINGLNGDIEISGNNITLVVREATPPTLAGTSIVDDKSGGPVDVNALVTYTVTFSEDMDSGSVSAADFGNAGTASITIGAVTETSPTSGVFTVQATPTTTGTLIFKVNQNAVLTDVVGNALNTTSAIVDNTTLIVNSAAYNTWANGYLPVDVSNPASNNDGDSLVNLQEFAFGTDPVTTTSGAISYVLNGDVTSPGLPVASNFAVGSGVDYRAVFGRRKDYVVAGLTYTVQFSADLSAWVNSGVTPTVLTSSSGPIDAVSVPYPFFISTARGVEKPMFFRIAISQTP